MLFYTFGQLDRFIAMALCGLLLGAWYDIMKRAYSLMSPGPVLGAIWDALCISGMFFILLLAMNASSRMDLRLYSLLSAALGMALYMLIVPPLIEEVGKCIKNCCNRLYNINNLKKILHFICR